MINWLLNSAVLYCITHWIYRLSAQCWRNITLLYTPNESGWLQLHHITFSKKIQYLLDVLPSKGENWFDKFIECLQKTSDGNGHEKIVRELEYAKKDIESRRKG